MSNSEFNEQLLSASLTKQKFADLTNTPIRTIDNWLGTRKGKPGKIPNWVEPYLNLYITNKDNETHIKKLYEELKKDNKSVKN
jgi:hypothetical protein